MHRSRKKEAMRNRVLQEEPKRSSSCRSNGIMKKN